MKTKYMPRAQLDLDLIWLRIVEYSMQAADKVIDSIKRDCQRLSLQPGMGEQCDYLSPNLRRISCGDYLIFFRSNEQHLEIIRVLHGARDVESLF